MTCCALVQNLQFCPLQVSDYLRCVQKELLLTEVNVNRIRCHLMMEKMLQCPSSRTSSIVSGKLDQSKTDVLALPVLLRRHPQSDCVESWAL